MSITTVVTVTENLPISVIIGVNGAIKVKAQGEAGDSLADVLQAATDELNGSALFDGTTLNDQVTIMSKDGEAREAADTNETVVAGDTVIVNEPKSNA